MNQAEKDEVIRMLTVAKEAFPNCNADSKTFALYCQVMNDMSATEIRAALLKCMRTAKFFPTIAEIIEAAESVKATANDNRLPDQSEAWKEAMDNVQRYGVYNKWKYSCKEVETACKRFGIHELCLLEEKDVNIARAQFFKIYNAVCSRGKEDRDNGKVLLAMGTQASSLIDAVANVRRLKEA